jgi:hypothetical protein
LKSSPPLVSTTPGLRRWISEVTAEDLVELISKDPEVMVSFFVMITRLSHRELRRRGLKVVIR